MGKKSEKKAAKGRLDKFYWLAKEQGYRSRAAFKLVQLNKKYAFLDKARCCIDLCAAPGGWLQVASKHMPQGSLIVGVDLIPIKPIPRCITFAEDINSYKCRDLIRDELKDWKADVVLHDGAPNVGTAWIQDAYTQNELVLQSLKLACEFLVPSGVFVTKVFRSKDYNSLLWVFNQLFTKVEATKPPSSRNVSAEIFVVCQGFKAPKRIDPKFLNPKYVFKDLDVTAATITGEAKQEGDKAEAPATASTSKALAAVARLAHNAQANVFEPEKRKRKRDGYEDGDYTLFKTITAKEFVTASDAVGMLGTFNQIVFPSTKRTEDPVERAIVRNELTSDDIKASCNDLRVLGKRDFRNLLKWRLSVREGLGLEVSAKAAAAAAAAKQAESSTAEEVPVNEEEMIDAELERLQQDLQRRQRKDRRKRNEAKQKEILKMQLKMGTPMDIGMELQDDALRGEHEFFDLGEKERAKRASATHDDASDDEADDDEDTSNSNEDVYVDAQEAPDSDDESARLARLEVELDSMYDRYKTDLQARDAKFKASEARRKAGNRAADDEEWYGIQDDPAEDSDAADQPEDSDEEEGGYDKVMARKDMEETFDTDDEEDEEEEGERRQQAASHSNPAGKRRKPEAIEQDTLLADDSNSRHLVTDLEAAQAKKERLSREASMWFDNPLFQDLEDLEHETEEEEGEESEDEDESMTSDSGTDESEEEEEVESAEDADDDFEIVPQGEETAFGGDSDNEWAFEDDDEDALKREKVEKLGLNTAEAVTMAQALVNRQATRAALVDAGFNKHTFTDKKDLPSWFLDDESKHYKSNVPITKEAVAALRARQRALDARPIKKIAEAKARKKLKAAQKLDKARKKAEGVLEDADDLNEKEKAGSIEKILKKGMKAQKKKEVKLVVAKGSNRGLKGRPKGIKGRYKMVDRRGKKELRAQKRRDKAAGKKTSSASNRPRRTPNGYSR